LPFRATHRPANNGELEVLHRMFPQPILLSPEVSAW
jgi:hypothetical protein